MKPHLGKVFVVILKCVLLSCFTTCVVFKMFDLIIIIAILAESGDYGDSL